VEGAVASLRKRHGFEVETVWSNTIPFFRRLFMPGFPAVAIDGEFVSKNRVIPEHELEAHVLRRL
jgi:hypothetical protein